MAYSHGTPNSIVTDGLVFAVDAANLRSWTGPDSSTVNNLVGTSTGTIFNDTSGSYGDDKSFAFDGVDDNINCGSATTYNKFTLSAWVNKNSSAPNYAGIFGTRNGSAVAFPYLLSLDNSNKIRLIADGTFNILSDNAINNDTWYHVVGTGDGTDLKMYINGQLQTATTSYSTPLLTTTNDLMIGAQWDTDTQYEWSGEISNVKLYDKGLSASEVKQNYNALKGRFE